MPVSNPTTPRLADAPRSGGRLDTLGGRKEVTVTGIQRVRRGRPLGFSFRLAVAILWPLMRTIVKWDIRGADALARIDGGVIVAPNHTSWFDPPVVAFALWQADQPPRFLGKESVFRIPLVGRLISGAGQIPVYRETADAAAAIRSALAALEAGTDKLRINPGNIRDPKLLRRIAREAMDRKTPIRVGVNAGSLDKDLLDRYGNHSAEALALSASNSVRLMEEEGVTDIVVSLKANDARWTVDAYRLFAEKSTYPLHLGVTEAGCGRAAVVNSWAGLGTLLQMGIGDTIRISLTEDSRLEVVVGHLLLHYLGLPRYTGPGGPA